MILYHGSNLDIKTIDLEKCRPYKDFGRGFYLTTIEYQARQMAVRVARIRDGSPFVNAYEVPDDFMACSELNTRDFGDTASEEWALFVMNNRNARFRDYASRECNHDNKYDIVRGPVADDDMAMLFRQYENRLIDFAMLKNGMTYKKMTNQYSFHTQRAIALLKKVDVLWTKRNS